MDSTLRDLEQWLNQQKTNTLHIYKEEQGDRDRTELRFDYLTIAKQQDPDDYVSPRSLLLHGKGLMETKTHPAPLPLDFFEIPLTDHFRIEGKEEGLAIYTDRAQYWIEPKLN